MNKQEVYEQCTVENNIIKLPNIKLERNEYLAIKKDFELLGGKWKSGKIQGFEFKTDPSIIFEQLKGKSDKVKKEFQFFGTPDKIADVLVQYADIKPKDLILEPSAGQGSIISAIKRNHSNAIEYCELMDINRTILSEKFNDSRHVGNDFLEYNPEYRYDKIIANPPFTKNQDIKHLKHMYSMLKNSGILVCITSTSWDHGTQKLQLEFKKWLETIKYEKIILEEGSFKESGTNVKTYILVIKK